MNDYPRYTDLPALSAGSDYRHAWDHYADDDGLGCLGRITPEARLRGLAAARDGVTVRLSLPLDLPDPPLFSRDTYRHTVFATGRNNLDDRLDGFYPQASTQWDGFRHVRAREFGFFTGVTDDQDGTRLGIGQWAAGIVGRGVLVDLADRWASEPGFTITADDLRSAAPSVEPGDILCVRTGWMRDYLGATPERRAEIAGSRAWPGLEASAAVAELLWDAGVAAVTADNPAVEVAPGSPAVGSLHRRLIPLLGMPLGELFDFEELAAECAARGRSTFLFAAVPLNLPGGVGSPGNAVAVL